MGAITIYALVDPRDDRVRYVGKTKDPSRRLRAHKYNLSNPGLRRWYADLVRIGLSPVMRVLRLVEDRDWQSAEIAEIARYVHMGLFNICRGGSNRWATLPKGVTP